MTETEYITRTIRIPVEYDSILREESDNKGRSITSLITRVLEKYVYFDRFYEEGQMMSVNPEEISSLLEFMDREDVHKAGRLAGSKRARDNLLMRGMGLDFGSVKWFITDIMSNYSGWFTCNYYERDSMHVFHIRHRMNDKWSLFIESYFEAMVENVLDIEVEADYMDGTVTLRIPVSSKD